MRLIHIRHVAAAMTFRAGDKGMHAHGYILFVDQHSLPCLQRRHFSPSTLPGGDSLRRFCLGCQRLQIFDIGVAVQAVLIRLGNGGQEFRDGFRALIP